MRRFAFVLLAFLIAVPGFAAGPRPAALSAQDQADLQRIERYLNDIRTLSARFEQFAQGGGTASGRAWIARPGRMRFEYDPPVPILLVANGTFVNYWDAELEQLTSVPVRSTPAWFLLRDEIRLSGDITVTRFERSPGVLRVTLVETSEPGAGSLTLVFSERPFDLRQWTVVDQQGKATTIVLSETRINGPVDQSLFQFVDPRFGRNRPDR